MRVQLLFGLMMVCSVSAYADTYKTLENRIQKAEFSLENARKAQNISQIATAAYHLAIVHADAHHAGYGCVTDSTIPNILASLAPATMNSSYLKKAARKNLSLTRELGGNLAFLEMTSAISKDSFEINFGKTTWSATTDNSLWPNVSLEMKGSGKLVKKTLIKDTHDYDSKDGSYTIDPGEGNFSQVSITVDGKTNTYRLMSSKVEGIDQYRLDGGNASESFFNLQSDCG